MPVPNQPSMLTGVIGEAADVLPIQATTPPGTGALSYHSGWPPLTSMPLEVGGIAPQREYFNAINKLITEHLFFMQSGGVYAWNERLDYLIGSHILGSDGYEYVAVKASGPNTHSGTGDLVGAINPTRDTGNYWTKIGPFYPDGDTIRIGADNKLYVDIGKFLQAGGGLQVKNGKIYFDADSMDKSVFEKMLKALKMMIPLESNMNYYVDISHANASDTIDEGRGLSANKPFRTIQACVNYITGNFNLGVYTVKIYVANGRYDDITLPAYATTEGEIYIIPVNPMGVTIGSNSMGHAINLKGGFWGIENIKISKTVDFTGVTEKKDTSGITAYNGTMIMRGCQIQINYTGNPVQYNSIYGILGNVRMVPNDLYNNQIAVEGPAAGNLNKYCIYADYGTTIQARLGRGADKGEIQVAGDYNTVLIAYGGRFEIGGTFYSDTVNVTFGVIPGKTVTGKRYWARVGGQIDTGRAGAEFFPGSIEGMVEADTYSWYR